MIFIAENEKELGDKVWHEIKDKLPNGIRIGLIGDLGAGKTTLVQEVAKHLGLSDKITSPTFNLRKTYAISLKDRGARLQHIDLYRIAKASKADLLEIKEWLNSKDDIIFIEWIDNIPQFKDYLDLIVNIKAKGKAKRKVEMKWL